MTCQHLVKEGNARNGGRSAHTYKRVQLHTYNYTYTYTYTPTKGFNSDSSDIKKTPSHGAVSGLDGIWMGMDIFGWGEVEHLMLL